MKFLYILLLLLLVQKDHAKNVQVISKFLQDLIENERIPTVLSAFTCLSKSDQFQFTKMSKVPLQLNNQFRIPPRHSDDSTNKLLHFIDMNCNGSYEFLYTIEHPFFSHPYRWVLLEPDESRLSNLTFLTDSNVIFIYFNADQSRYDLRQVYKIDKQQTDFISETFGHWNNEEGLSDLRETRILSRRRRDLRGKVLKSILVITSNSSFGQLDDRKDYEIDHAGKVGYCITNLVAETVNASVTYDYVNTWGYGDMKHPEKISGLFGPLVRNEIDLGGTVMFLTPNRLPYLEYLSRTLPSPLAFVFRAPPLSYTSNIFYLPFNTTVWICSICLVIICTLIIFSMFRLSEQTNFRLSFSDAWLFAMSTVCQMGSNLTPTRLSTKIATYVFCMSAIFIFISYSANIMALLQSTSESIQTLSDLLESNMELGVEDSSYSRHYFPIETEPIRKKIYETKVAPPNQHPHFLNVTFGVGKMQKGSYAFHMGLDAGYKKVEQLFQEHEKCGLVEIRYLQNSFTMHVTPKNSPYKEIFKVSLFKLHEHGIQSIILNQRRSKRPTCNSHAPRFESVRLIDCYAVVMVFCYGIAAAFLILAIEFIIRWKINCSLLIFQ